MPNIKLSKDIKKKGDEKKDKKKALESLDKAAKLDPSGPIGKQAKAAAEDLKKKK